MYKLIQSQKGICDGILKNAANIQTMVLANKI